MTTIGFETKKISLIHVDDLVRGFILAAESEKAKNEIYFISSEKYYTWEEIGNVTSKVLDKKPFRVKVPHPVVYTIAGIAQFFAILQSASLQL